MSHGGCRVLKCKNCSPLLGVTHKSRGLSCIKMQELQPFSRSHTRVTGVEFGSSECEAWLRTNPSLLFSILRMTFKVPRCALSCVACWKLQPPTADRQTDRQTGADVGTDTELGETLGRWPSPREWIIPDVKLYHLVVLISSYNKETGTRLILSQTYTVWT